MNGEKFIGAELDIPVKTRKDFSFFSESQSRVIVSIDANSKEMFENYLRDKDQYFLFLGITGGDSFIIKNNMEIDVNQLSDIYYNTISRIMNG